MDRIEIPLGDFRKNAGVIGMYYALTNAEAEENVDYGVESQLLWLNREYALRADWTDICFKAFVHYMGPNTVYQKVLDKLESHMEKLSRGVWKGEKTEREDLKFINDKLLSNSYQSGFENIKNRTQNPQVYENLRKEKLKDKLTPEELLQRMTELRAFLLQPLCKETFCMKSIIYNYINRFWDDKCFLLKANAKKDMTERFDTDFTEPLKRFLKSDQTNAKELCIDCGEPIGTKDKVPITFMNGLADDLTRKKSAFWNCKVDAFLCPMCALVYALCPLGFQQTGNKFVFINSNKGLQTLLNGNKKDGKIYLDAEKNEEEKYPSWFSRLLNLILDKKSGELRMVQVILKSTDARENFQLHVIGTDVLRILSDDNIRQYLKGLAQHPIIKDGNEFRNVHETAVMNILRYRNQYVLLNRLLKLTLENDGMLYAASYLHRIQLQTNMIKKQKQGGKDHMVQLAMVKNGYLLRKELLQKNHSAKGGDECLRGTVYQLLNALSVKNVHKFMEIILRLYCSCQKPVPEGLVWLMKDEENFMDSGYAFVLGLKGSYREKENEDE